MNTPCSVGLTLKTECHKQSYSKRIGLKNLESFDWKEREVILWRSGLSIVNVNATICHHHEHTVLHRFKSLQKTCFDPFKAHKRIVKG